MLVRSTKSSSENTLDAYSAMSSTVPPGNPNRRVGRAFLMVLTGLTAVIESSNAGASRGFGAGHKGLSRAKLLFTCAVQGKSIR
tara:strand:- start:287 stop:538 length:252 start_codon:yes stop_codon:yes gene_type:complete